jgi:hypothetical protein
VDRRRSPESRHQGLRPCGEEAGTQPTHLHMDEEGQGRAGTRCRTWTVWDWMLSTRPVSDGSATDRIGGRAIFGCTGTALLRPCSSGAHPNASLQHKRGAATRTGWHGSITPPGQKQKTQQRRVEVGGEEGRRRGGAGGATESAKPPPLDPSLPTDLLTYCCKV